MSRTGMKKKFLLILLFPFTCFAQKFYFQAGAGYQFPSSSANQGYAIELSSGVQMGPHFRLGVGTSYLEQNYNIGAAFVPVYADLKLLGSGKLKPYIFFQPGFCIYKSNEVFYLDYNGNELGKGYLNGSFCSNQGIGLIYKYVFLQAGFRAISLVSTSSYDPHKTYGQYTFGVTAGISLP
jgi:hypothetical protein